MILLFLWAFAGVVLGYESARHGIVQIIVPTLYLFGMFLWAVAGMVIFHFVTSRKARPVPTPQQVREAYKAMAKQPHALKVESEREP
jgi:hypothetical protein